jgi:glycosyltransferase 2 family protein
MHRLASQILCYGGAMVAATEWLEGVQTEKKAGAMRLLKDHWRHIFNIVRWTVTGGLLVYLVWRADPAKLWEAWGGVDGRLLGLALALQLVGIALSSLKWSVILGARGHHLPYRWLMGTYLVGQFANNFLPTGVGGDAVRVVQLGRRVGSYSQSSASVFVDRLTGFLALSLIANVALVLTYTGMAGFQLTASNPSDHQFLNDTLLFLITIGFTLVALVAVVGCFIASWLHKTFGSRLPDFVDSPMEKVARSLSDYFPKGRSLVLVIGISLMFQSLWVVINYVCGLALGIEAPFLMFALIAPITDILGLVPLFVNNLGARELVFTFFLFYVGVPKATALALAFMVLTVRLVVSLLGGVVMLFGGADLRVLRKEPRPPGAEAIGIEAVKR